MSIPIRYRYDTFKQKYRNFDTDTIVSKGSDNYATTFKLGPTNFMLLTSTRTLLMKERFRTSFANDLLSEIKDLGIVIREPF